MSESVRRRRPTQADVARVAGVSQAMVSYVLNGSTSVTVPPETQQRIRDAMDAVGYVPNRAARSLRTSRTMTIAGIIPDIANPFYPAFIRGVQDVADRHGYDLVMYNTDGSAEKEHKFVRSIQGRVDGVVGVFFHTSAHELAQLVEQQVAVVRLEATPKRPGALPIDNIYVDNVAAAHAAVRYLLDAGYRRIAMLANTPGPGEPRVEGYKLALAERGSAPPEGYIERCDFTEAGGHGGMQRLLDLPDRPDAVFAANDLMAIGALVAIKAQGLRVPQDVALMGFDDIPTDRLVSPALTTVTQFQDQLGHRAAQMLFDRILDSFAGPGRNEEMPYRVIVRESA